MNREQRNTFRRRGGDSLQFARQGILLGYQDMLKNNYIVLLNEGSMLVSSRRRTTFDITEYLTEPEQYLQARRRLEISIRFDHIEKIGFRSQILDLPASCW